MNSKICRNHGRMLTLWVTVIILILTCGAMASSESTVDSLLQKWTASGDFKNEVQDFAAEGNKDVPYPELVVVSEVDALKTAIEAVLNIEGIQADEIAEYEPSVEFKAIGTEYSYDVRFIPQNTAADTRAFYIEVGASFEDNMLRYHVLTDDGSETVSIKFYSGDQKDIVEQEYWEYMAERAGG